MFNVSENLTGYTFPCNHLTDSNLSAVYPFREGTLDKVPNRLPPIAAPTFVTGRKPLRHTKTT